MKNLIWAVICLAIGAILALLLQDLGYFVYENSFNLFELLYFVLTAAIAIFVTSRLDEAIQRRRLQKDLIIHKIEEVDNEIKNLYDLFSANKNNQYLANNTSLLRKIKNIGLWAKRYEKSINTYYPKIKTKYTKINTRKLVAACTKIPRSNDSSEISCKDNEWTYSEDRYTQIQTEIEALRSICFDNIILLNNE